MADVQGDYVNAWAAYIRRRLSTQLKITTMPTKGPSLRTEINVKFDGKLIMTGLVHGVDPDEDAVDIAAQSVIMNLLPKSRNHTLHFFVCGHSIAFYKVDERRLLECTSYHVSSLDPAHDEHAVEHWFLLLLQKNAAELSRLQINNEA